MQIFSIFLMPDYNKHLYLIDYKSIYIWLLHHLYFDFKTKQKSRSIRLTRNTTLSMVNFMWFAATLNTPYQNIQLHHQNFNTACNWERLTRIKLTSIILRFEILYISYIFNLLFVYKNQNCYISTNITMQNNVLVLFSLTAFFSIFLNFRLIQCRNRFSNNSKNRDSEKPVGVF